jgi:hypothetical protein
MSSCTSCIGLDLPSKSKRLSDLQMEIDLCAPEARAWISVPKCYGDREKCLYYTVMGNKRYSEVGAFMDKMRKLAAKENKMKEEDVTFEMIEIEAKRYAKRKIVAPYILPTKYPTAVEVENFILNGGEVNNSTPKTIKTVADQNSIADKFLAVWYPYYDKYNTDSDVTIRSFGKFIDQVALLKNLINKDLTNWVYKFTEPNLDFPPNDKTNDGNGSTRQVAEIPFW